MRWDLLTDSGAVHTMDAPDAVAAARRAADLHGCTIVATRPSQVPAIRVGFDLDQDATPSPGARPEGGR
jgi:hypothetical protein